MTPTPLSSNPVVMGLDTGFSNIGFTFARLDGPQAKDLTILEIGYFDTEKASGKNKGIRSADDNFERARTIARVLFSHASKWKPRVITFESMSFVRSAPTMAKIGMCFGVVAALVEQLDVPVMAAMPTEIKKALTGGRDASKADVQQALDVLFGDFPKRYLDSVHLAKSKREHPYDSLGSIIACWDTEIMRLMRAQVMK